MEGGEDSISALEYGARIAAFLAADSEAPPEIRETSALALKPEASAFDLHRLDALRHLLIRHAGQAPADWDLIDPATGRLDSGQRQVHAGLRAYLEDIRSPFNIGSIFRTADAFGVEELVLSPSSADPEHPRARRSAMGATNILPWRRGGLEILGRYGPAFALELGGSPLEEFAFPQRGIVILGSEELGVSREAIDAASLGRVSIPMFGAKASLNVGVAFGILMQAWTASLARAAMAEEFAPAGEGAKLE